MKSKVIVRMPVRINFGGAWSDTPPFCIKEGGCVCNASAIINKKKPIIITIEKIKENKIIIENNNDVIEIKNINELENINNKEKFALEKITLKIYDIKKLGFKLSINIINIPRGSGLGTSSILALAILKALYIYEKNKTTEEDLINKVLTIEKKLGTGGGWQDQAGAIRKGIKLISSNPGEIQILKIENIKIPIIAKKELKRRFILIYTGETRESSEIVIDIAKKWQEDKEERQKIINLKEIATNMKYNLEKGKIDEFAILLNKNYEITKTLNNKIVSPVAQKIFDITEDITSGKMICGAGNGGFIEIILKKGIKKQEINKRLQKEFANTDVKIWKVELE